MMMIPLRNNNFQVPETKVVRKLFVPRKNEIYGESSFVTYALHPVSLHSKMKVSTCDSLNGQNKHCLQNSYDESLLESHQLKKKHTCKDDTNIIKTNSKNETVERQSIMDSHWYSSVTQKSQKAYDSDRKEELYNICTEIEVSMKLVGMIKMCLHETCSKVCAGKHLSDNFLSKETRRCFIAITSHLCLRICH
jgi:hypothetical protein